MTHDMTLRGATVALFGVVLGCYGMPKIGGLDAGDAGGTDSGVAGTGGSQAAGRDGGAGVGGGGAGARGGQGGSASGGVGASSGGGRGVSSGGAQGGTATGGQGGTSGGAGSAATGGVSGGGGTAGVGGTGGVAGAAAAGAGGGGTCNPACDAIHICTGGRCLLADAQQCVTASQCSSGACNPFYKDVDGDGYGTGQAVGFCTLTAPPIGYATQTGDCCDDAANIALAKLIHPGADFQTTSAGGICNGITWDYDCNGTIESNPQTIACNDDPPSCSYRTVNYEDSACGSALLACGCAVAGPSCLRICSGTPGNIGCK